MRTVRHVSVIVLLSTLAFSLFTPAAVSGRGDIDLDAALGNRLRAVPVDGLAMRAPTGDRLEVVGVTAAGAQADQPFDPDEQPFDPSDLDGEWTGTYTIADIWVEAWVPEGQAEADAVSQSLIGFSYDFSLHLKAESPESGTVRTMLFDSTQIVARYQLDGDRLTFSSRAPVNYLVSFSFKGRIARGAGGYTLEGTSTQRKSWVAKDWVQTVHWSGTKPVGRVPTATNPGTGVTGAAPTTVAEPTALGEPANQQSKEPGAGTSGWGPPIQATPLSSSGSDVSKSGAPPATAQSSPDGSIPWGPIAGGAAAGGVVIGIGGVITRLIRQRRIPLTDTEEQAEPEATDLTDSTEPEPADTPDSTPPRRSRGPDSTPDEPSIGEERNGKVWYQPPWESGGPYWMNKAEYDHVKAMHAAGNVWHAGGWMTPETKEQFDRFARRERAQPVDLGEEAKREWERQHAAETSGTWTATDAIQTQLWILKHAPTEQARNDMEELVRRMWTAEHGGPSLGDRESIRLALSRMLQATQDPHLTYDERYALREEQMEAAMWWRDQRDQTADALGSTATALDLQSKLGFANLSSGETRLLKGVDAATKLHDVANYFMGYRATGDSNLAALGKTAVQVGVKWTAFSMMSHAFFNPVAGLADTALKYGTQIVSGQDRSPSKLLEYVVNRAIDKSTGGLSKKATPQDFSSAEMQQTILDSQYQAIKKRLARPDLSADERGKLLFMLSA